MNVGEFNLFCDNTININQFLKRYKSNKRIKYLDVWSETENNIYWISVKWFKFNIKKHYKQ